MPKSATPKKAAPAKAKAARKPSAAVKAKRAKKPPYRQMTVELADKRAINTVGNLPFDSVAFLRSLR